MSLYHKYSSLLPLLLAVLFVHEIAQNAILASDPTVYCPDYPHITKKLNLAGKEFKIRVADDDPYTCSFKWPLTNEISPEARENPKYTCRGSFEQFTRIEKTHSISEGYFIVTLTFEFKFKPGMQHQHACDFAGTRKVCEPKILPMFKLANPFQTKYYREGQRGEFKCDAFGSDEKGQMTLSWRMHGEDKSLENNTRFTFDNHSMAKDRGAILAVTMGDHKKVIICKATNSVGSSELPIMVMVKSQLAALWPFLGIVAEVIVLVTILIFCEKRRKSIEENAVTNTSNVQKSKADNGHEIYAPSVSEMASTQKRAAAGSGKDKAQKV